MIIEFG